jgi:hypothetical protein
MYLAGSSENWELWNAAMRDALISKQDKGEDGKHAHQKGSWSPSGDRYDRSGGRIMVTSLALLTLEIYYRYPRGAGKAEDK